MKEISTLSQYINVVKDITCKEKENNNFFYRGQCNDYMPLPSAFREGFMEKENYLYHELILRCPENFNGLSHLDVLVKMQHYGLPTRLLDVTINPLVALYFACKDYTGSHTGKKGKVFIYGISDSKVAYSDSDRVLMLSCLPVFTFEDKSKMHKIVESAVEKGKFDKNIDKKYPAALERLYHEITKEIPTFKREISPNDLISPIIVKPMRANARILKQDGAFIISGLCKDKNEAESKINGLCTDTIEISNREEILRELDIFGINEASLFPEVDKVADYLKARCKSKSN